VRAVRLRGVKWRSEAWQLSLWRYDAAIKATTCTRYHDDSYEPTPIAPVCLSHSFIAYTSFGTNNNCRAKLCHHLSFL